MHLAGRTVIVGEDWTLVTNVVSVLQFNDIMEVTINNGGVPTTDGMTVAIGETYTNGAEGLHVWAKKLVGGSGVESIRVLESIA